MLADVAHLEFLKILEEQCRELGDGFESANTDFWTDLHQKEYFGALLVDVTAFHYELEGGQTVFMSQSTKEQIDDTLFSKGCVFFLLVSSC